MPAFGENDDLSLLLGAMNGRRWAREQGWAQESRWARESGWARKQSVAAYPSISLCIYILPSAYYLHQLAWARKLPERSPAQQAVAWAHFLLWVGFRTVRTLVEGHGETQENQQAIDSISNSNITTCISYIYIYKERDRFYANIHIYIYIY